MARLLVHVEGETEETFVNEVLCRHLIQSGFESVGARLIGNARQRSRRGGIRSWQSVRADIVRHLREDTDCVATTMVDYYGLPQNGDKAWPGRAAAAAVSSRRKPTVVEQALREDIAATMGVSFHSDRFVPFVIMHEFEGLLFSDCAAFAHSIGIAQIRTGLQQIRDRFDTPEDINDSPLTAPSKRVQVLVPGYQKPLFGNLAALAIGLGTIRGECPHFDQWVSKLESIAHHGLTNPVRD